MNWMREEDILVLGLYFQVGRKGIAANHPGVVELSSFMRRKPSSIAMRTGNFVAVDPKNPLTGLNHPAIQTQKIWREFCDQPSLLEKECEQIRQNRKGVFEQREKT